MDDILMYGLAILLGMILAFKLVQDKQKGTTTRVRISPTIDAISYIDAWLPKDNRSKNILLGKIIVLVYILIALMINYTFLYLMIVLPILFHIEYFKEDD
jgi:hypothetical protein